jgi:AbrB family looped-hinge helix DNA binding protein
MSYREAEMQTVMSSKGQAVIPKPVREALGLMPGDRIDISIEGGSARLTPVRPAKADAVVAAVGLLKAKRGGGPRRLLDFDPASLLEKSRR